MMIIIMNIIKSVSFLIRVQKRMCVQQSVISQIVWHHSGHFRRHMSLFTKANISESRCYFAFFFFFVIKLLFYFSICFECYTEKKQNKLTHNEVFKCMYVDYYADLIILYFFHVYDALHNFQRPLKRIYIF